LGSNTRQNSNKNERCFLKEAKQKIKRFFAENKNRKYFGESHSPDCFWVMIRGKEKKTFPLKIQKEPKVFY
jgi:hypothetical protein